MSPRAAWLGLVLVACGPSTEEIVGYIGSENPVVREDWAVMAASHKDPEVVTALVGVLADPSDTVRLAAAASLGDIGDLSAAPALITRLREDANPKVREAAADSLGRIRATEAISDLLAYTSAFDVNDQAQLVGIWALGHITAGETDKEKRRPVVEFLVSRREQATDRFVRYGATSALRELE